jgi:hypothetical protein
MDVTILREACIAFRQIFMDLMGEDPFIKNATIAGLTMRLYRMLYLVDDDIPIVPEGGYNRHEMQSKEALRWLAWYSHSRKVPVRTCESPEGEMRFGMDGSHCCPGVQEPYGYRVDGYIRATPASFEKDGKYGTILEFHGNN